MFRLRLLLLVAVLCAALQVRSSVGCSISSQWSLSVAEGSATAPFFQAAVVPSPYCHSLLERGYDINNLNHSVYAVELTKGTLAWQWSPHVNDTFNSIMNLAVSSTGHRVYLSPIRPRLDGIQCSVTDAIDSASRKVAFSHTLCGQQKGVIWASNVVVLANSSSATGRGRIVHYMAVNSAGNDYLVVIAVLDATTGEQLSTANFTVTSSGALTAVDEGREGYLLYQDVARQHRSYLLQVDANNSTVRLIITAPVVPGVLLYSEPLLTLYYGEVRAANVLNGSTAWYSSDAFLLGLVNLSTSTTTYHTYYMQLTAQADYFAVLNAAVSSGNGREPLTRLGQVAIYRLADGHQVLKSPVMEFHTNSSHDSMKDWICWYELDGALLIATFDTNWLWYQLDVRSLKVVSHGHYPNTVFNFAVSADGSYIVASPVDNTISGYPAIIDRTSAKQTVIKQNRHSRTV